MASERQRLINQLGTGAIPADEEKQLLAGGTKFAAYWQPSSGKPILITSVYEDIFKRLLEQLNRQHNERFGLPSEYRIPIPTP